MAQKPSAPDTSEKTEIVASTSPSASEDSTSKTSSEMAHEQREEFASKLVDRFAIWSGVAGLLPVPVVDVLAVGGLQLQMLRRLSQVYGVPFSDNRGKSLIASWVGSTIPATSGIGAASALKFLPVVGTIASAFVAPVLSAGATYAIGKVFIQHFETGGTLLDFNLPAYREFIKAHKEMWDKRATGSSGPSKPGTSDRANSAGATATTS
jgi:uncharacterized protein (DUF697 family)